MFKRSKLAVLSGALAAALSTGAVADAMWYDAGQAGGGCVPADFAPCDADTLTAVFNQFGFFANTTSVFTGFTAGSTFVDEGNAVLTSMIPGQPINGAEGLEDLDEFTVTWENLTGTVDTSPADAGDGTYVMNISYDAGAIFNFYYDADSLNSDHGSGLGTSDDVNFDDGTLVITVQLTGGGGIFRFSDSTLTELIGSGTTLEGTVTSVLNDMFYFDNGDGVASAATDSEWNDLLGKPVTIAAFVDQNTDNLDLTSNPDGSFTIDSDHDGSIDFTGEIPEPATLALLGLGLVGLGSLRRRRV